MDDWQPKVPEGYNDANRAFLQALMGHGSMTFGQGQQTLAAILREVDHQPVDPASVTIDEFTEYINIARQAVSQLDLDIRTTQHQLNKERIWALVNTQSDPSTQMATTHSVDEIAYINRLLHAMFATHNTVRMEVMAVDEKQALQVSRPPRRESQANAGGDEEGSSTQAVATDRGLKHSEVITLLRSLVEEGWLEESEEKFYSLSPRALMELRSWLLTTFNDEDSPPDEWRRIKNCMACKEIITMGQRCADRDCLARLHDICAQPFWRSRKETQCPMCKTAWDARHFVGQRAVTSTEAYHRAKGPRSRKSNPSTTRTHNSREEEAGEEEDEEAEDDD